LLCLVDFTNNVSWSNSCSYSNDECEIIGRLQKLTDDNTPGECYTFSITGIKNKRVILLPNDLVTFSIAVEQNYSTRAVNIVLENEIRKGKVDIVKGQVTNRIEFAKSIYENMI